MVFKGTLLMDFRDGRTVVVNEGEILIVPKGVEHKPHTNGEIVFNLLFEPKATLHKGNVDNNIILAKNSNCSVARTAVNNFNSFFHSFSVYILIERK